VFSSGDTDTGPFASFNYDARVNVNATEATARAVTVVYTATDGSGNYGCTPAG